MKKVIILHGWTKNLDKWDKFLKELDKNGIKYNFPKIPGFTVSLEKIWELQDYIDWLKNIVDKEKGKVILIGHSNGGRIALAFTNRYPEKVEKLILIDSAGIYHNELPIKIKRVVFKTIAKIGKKLSSSERLKDLLYKIVGESDYKNATTVMKQTMINLINSDKFLSLCKVEVPTLIIWGREDKTTPLSDATLMHKLIKNSNLQIIEDAQHSPMFTNPEEVAKIIYEYI